MRRLVLILACVLAPLGAGAQDRAETLADIRQELSMLYVEVQRLKRELSTTGAAPAVVGGRTALERLDLIEAELTRLTGLTEDLQNRIAAIVKDGTNRIGDLEFRLVELEGGDVSQLGETTTLGGEAGLGLGAAGSLATQPVTEPGSGDGGTELAVAEKEDFDAALAAFEAGAFQEAAVKFTVFTETYPVGPLTGEAHFYRGEALTALGDTANAARAYLESFSGAPENPRAADALLQLGLALADLGQTNEACVALGEVPTRYPGSTAAQDAIEAAEAMDCR